MQRHHYGEFSGIGGMNDWPSPAPVYDCAYVWDGSCSWVPVPLTAVTGDDWVLTDYGPVFMGHHLTAVPAPSIPQFTVGGELSAQLWPPRFKAKGYRLLPSFLAIAGLILVWHGAPILFAAAVA